MFPPQGATNLGNISLPGIDNGGRVLAAPGRFSLSATIATCVNSDHVGYLYICVCKMIGSLDYQPLLLPQQP